MTPTCIKLVEDKTASCEWFALLSVEQLLYAAIRGTGDSTREVSAVLFSTEWTNLIKAGEQYRKDGEFK